MRSDVCLGCGTAIEQPRLGARKWCSDHCRKQTLYSGTCIDCGGRTPYSGTTIPHKRCSACGAKHSAERIRENWAGYRQLVEEMWAEGMTARQIGEALGWPGKTPPNQIIVNARRRGYNLPHRRTPEQLTRMAVGSDERMATARAVKAAMR